MNAIKLLFNRAGWAGASSLLFPFTILRLVNPPEMGLFASDKMSEHNSMGFLGVKKRHPYPWEQPSFGAGAMSGYR